MIDWEIFNRPNKGSLNGFSHFGIKVERADSNPNTKTEAKATEKRDPAKNVSILDARVLHSDLYPPYTGEYGKAHFSSFGFGPSRHTMAGVPHFRDLDFYGNFPIAELKFKDEGFPGAVSMEAFNPFIPLDDKNSSIPAAFFSIKVKNNTKTILRYTMEGTLGTPMAEGEWKNQFASTGKVASITTRSSAFAADGPRNMVI